ncbi:MAG: DUF2764 family protein [Bacteroidales bacterium]|nr:DUF2764 family protein [Bacteroidales bacterium]
MDNYPYIIASLPDLALDFEKHDFDYDFVRENIFFSLSQEDRRLVEWLEQGFVDENLTEDFYRSCRRCGNRFIREYFAFDWLLRTEKVAFLERRESGEDFEEKEALRKAFVTPDILRREQAVCNVVWDKIENLVMLDVFNINVILAFLAKFHIIARWNRLDRVTGRKLFDDFVQEIDETYDKNKIEF